MDSIENRLETAVQDILDRHPGIGLLDAILLAAVKIGLSNDSRQLAKLLETEHALVLRALTGLIEDGRLMESHRHARTARIQVAITGQPTPGPLTQTGRSPDPAPHHPR